MKEITITSLQAGQRLDRLLSRYLQETGPGFVYKMLRKKNITLNGHKAKGSEKLAEGDCIRLFFSEETLDKLTGGGRSAIVLPGPELRPDRRMAEGQSDRRADKGPFGPGRGHRPPAGGGFRMPNVLYEDANVLLVNKPAGLLTQKAQPGDVSLNELALTYLLGEGALSREDLLTFRPSVCNRLDRNTSGLVAVGKSMAGLQDLSRIFRDRSLRKTYLALVLGDLAEEGHIDGWLLKEERTNQVRILDREEKGAQRIATSYRPADRIRIGCRSYTLLEVDLLTGRSHQIRAHLASIGHPIAGDPKYGRARVNADLKRQFGLRRQLLHAFSLTFPAMEGSLKNLSGVCCKAPLPGDFAALLQAGHRQDETGRD